VDGEFSDSGDGDDAGEHGDFGAGDFERR